jgi:16S rRNA (uracil1498-N3)-methyltransferase
MRLNRFIGAFDLSQNEIFVEDKEFYNQIKNVLRLAVGSKIILCDGKNNQAEGKIIAVADKGIRIGLSGMEKNLTEPEFRLTIYCSILKRENFELVAQKVTEIGARKIVPIITAHTIKQEIKTDRIKLIIKEAAEQSGRGILMELSGPISFKEAVREAENEEIKIIFDKSGEKFNSISDNVSGASIFIGPEGGWDESELKLAKENGFRFYSLGGLTLRGETAAIVASYLVLHGK